MRRVSRPALAAAELSDRRREAPYRQKSLNGAALNCTDVLGVRTERERWWGCGAERV
jgi:hypothetical protein